VDEACAEMLPDEHRAGHVHVRRSLSLEQVMDLVREVDVARHDADVELDSALLFELARVALNARDVRIGIGPEEANGAH
jgi:hypothetical protein